MRPNIVLYFTDQQRADTCGCYGQPLDITFHLNQLAREGVQFDWAMSPQPVCGPFRAMLQTGQWPTTTGCFRNNVMLPQGIPTLAQYMQQAGYETAYIGKWHLASDGGLEQKPLIDHTTRAVPAAYRGGYEGYWMASDVLEFTSDGYQGFVFDKEDKRQDFVGYRPDCITDFALDFFPQRDQSKPFFMTISHIEPHHQNDAGHYQGPEGAKERFKDFTLPGDLDLPYGDARQEYPDYLGACHSLDENLGRLIARLKAEGLYDNTVIFFFSDHGAHFRTRNRDGHLQGFDDYKRSCHDAALHVPLVIAGGPYTGGKRVRDIVSTASLPKSILALAGVDIGQDMIGEDLLQVALGLNPLRDNEAFSQISESRVGRSLRTPLYTYAVYAPGINGGEKASSEHYVDDFLYDLRDDPHQQHNLINNPLYQDEKLQLRQRLLRQILRAEGLRPLITDA